MPRSAQDHDEAERGFTLVELLVVVLIIGILAAIAIPSFLGQRDRAKDADAKSSARSAQLAMESCVVPVDGYSDCTKTDLEEIEPTLKSATFELSDVTMKGYKITVSSASGHRFVITRHDDGEIERTTVGGGTW